MALPDWVQAFKEPGKEIKENNGKYYLYERKTVYDKEKKQAKKITGAYLGRITQEGFISKKSVIVPATPIPDLEYGASKCLHDLSSDIRERLELLFPADWKEIYLLAVLRTIEMSPFKRVQERYLRSYLSILYPGLDFSGKSLSLFLKRLGDRRPAMVEFMKAFISGTEHIIFDGTRITTCSENMYNSKMGYNNNGSYDPQINLMYAFSSKPETSPVYYRTFSGNICDVKSFRDAVRESGIEDMVVIADKGFGSDANFGFLEEQGLRYLVPLRRNSRYFDRESIACKKYTNTFLFNERPIWYFERGTEKEGIKVITYLDKDLELREQRDYMKRIECEIEGYTEAGLFERADRMGILLIRTNMDMDGKEAYELYKKRALIEDSFDLLKNTLEADRSYMQKDVSFEGWAFLNHLSLMMIYRLYVRMKEADMLSGYSVKDCLFFLSGIRKQRQGKNWETTLTTRKTDKILSLLRCDI